MRRRRNFKTVRGTNKRPNTIRNLARRISKLERATELKEHTEEDLSLPTGDTNGYWTIGYVRVHNITQGDGDGHRDGDRILIQSLAIKGMLTHEDATQQTMYRMIIFNDRRPDRDWEML